MLTAQLHAASIIGQGREIASNVVHPNGNVYDQVLLQGTSVSVQNDAGQITRISFIDLSDDIVQVEFGGAGALTLILDGATGPAAPINYNQPDVQYMRGLATIKISGSDASTQLTVYSVGTRTAINQGLFRPDVVYDGYADIALIQIIATPESPFGSTFGGIRAGNTRFWAAKGYTGIYAPSVHVQSRVIISDVSAYDSATPALVFGRLSQFSLLEVAGGSLHQPNGRAIVTDGFGGVVMMPASSSHGVPLPVSVYAGQFETTDGRPIDMIVFSRG